MLTEPQQRRVIAEKIILTGTVQGVGLRPFIWRLAHACGIRGQVSNADAGVQVIARGSSRQIDTFVQRLAVNAPAGARIDTIRRHQLVLDSPAIADDFVIADSSAGNGLTDVAVDTAICPDCHAEINDSADRRYRYPFTTCSSCGPRYSIVATLPYDRDNTSMAAFAMCRRCEHEYRNSHDRRYHAQTNACPVCGPQCWLEDQHGGRIAEDASSDALMTAARLLRQGAIIAIKGVGGFHLACDAGNARAIARLRRAKQRPYKPLALMARDIAMVSAYAVVDETAARTLTQAAAPITLLPALVDNGLPDSIAPAQTSVGFMLPATPMHHLLLQDLDRPLVMTSGNRHGEPLLIDNEDARRDLRGIADYLLLNDRNIIHRVDDSVVRIMAGSPRLLRRARGYAPQTIALPDGFDRQVQILAMGGQQKNTFCLIRQGKAMLSPHIGDLDNVATYSDYQHQLHSYRRLFAVEPAIIAVDRHPAYLSTQLGGQYSADFAVRLYPVQHHHAHIAAVMIDHGLPPDSAAVLGVALDGSGYGDDGTVWGGEFLLADYRNYTRVGRFRPVPLPGGSRAVREPWLNTYAQLTTCMGWDTVVAEYAGLECIHFIRQQALSVVQTMIRRNINTPLTSSAGRLFDAVAAFLGICRQAISYQGQAAIELEALATSAMPDPDSVSAGYGHRLLGDCIDWQPLWAGLLADVRQGVDRETMAARFHLTVIAAVTEMTLYLTAQHDVSTVVLSGGVFQNRLLLEGVDQLLRRRGLEVLSPCRIPANDGGLALGQAVIAQAALM